MRREFIINGNHFNDWKGFFDEVEAVFTRHLDWEIGRNLDAFNDILRGGFGRHTDHEPILIKWVNFEKSEQDLGKRFMRSVIWIINDTDAGHDCQLVKL